MKPSQLGWSWDYVSTYEGKVDTLNYKPSDTQVMENLCVLMYEMVMKEDLGQLEKILTNAKPPSRRISFMSMLLLREK